jgi:MFS family permease
VSAVRADGHDPYAALRFRDFRFLLTGRILANIGGQMLDVAVGWELYERTHSAWLLGLVGLVLAIPLVTLALPGGYLADRHDRRSIVVLSQLLVLSSSLGLAVVSYRQGSIPLMYLFLFLSGVGAAFSYPATAALLPQAVPLSEFGSAVTWNSTGFQVASVTGPALGGLVIGLTKHAAPVYVIDAALSLAFLTCVALISGRQGPRSTEALSLRALLAGGSFVWQTDVILAAITLDLFAVLFGGATTLLPIFAKDILHVGPQGLGWLRASPSVGAALMALIIAHRPPMRRAGRALLWAVVGFGLATIGFGLSRSFALSMVMLFLTGAFDNVSVVIRQSLVQMRAPDEVRGRVSAVNGIFIDTSHYIGGWESGATAALFGPVLSVVGGGILTLVVIAAVFLRWPALRQLDALSPG